MIGCPKLDDNQFYLQKLTELFRNSSIKSITVMRMEVPCCGGMTAVLKEAISRSGRKLPLSEVIVGVKGEVLSEKNILD